MQENPTDAVTLGHPLEQYVDLYMVLHVMQEVRNAGLTGQYLVDVSVFTQPGGTMYHLP